MNISESQTEIQKEEILENNEEKISTVDCQDIDSSENRQNIDSSETIEYNDSSNEIENNNSLETGEQEDFSPEQTKLNEVKEELANTKEILLRTAAEYDNFRKRSAIEKQSAYTISKIETVSAILPVADNLERALEASKDEESELKKGLEMTMQQLIDCFKKIGVESIDSNPGTKFDPELHNAVMHVEDKTVEQNIIVECFQKGYKLEDKVIRYAMVKVAN